MVYGLENVYYGLGFKKGLLRFKVKIYQGLLGFKVKVYQVQGQDYGLLGFKVY